jgi:hypothetical protein
MKRPIALALAIAAISIPLVSARSETSMSVSHSELAHAERTFTFSVDAPPDQVGPLFGAEKERAWAPGWNPEFVWPRKAADQTGMVFTIGHGADKAIWVSTAFDQPGQHCQYVYVLPGTMVTVITLDWAGRGENTFVTVKYDRTALSPAANPLVEAKAAQDAQSGPEWAGQIASYLKTAGNRR